MNYGMPYKGSKNKIAKWVLDRLPDGDVFVDLFGGGGAITHAAALSGKYNRIIYNDIDPLVSKAFKTAVNGGFRNERRWISREDFFRLKDTDFYVVMCFSFGNGLKDYAYSKEVEPWKKALHYARIFGDLSEFAKFGIKTDGSRADIKAHKDEYKKAYIDWYMRENSESLQSLERLQSLEIYNTDYQNIEIPPDSVIYCDIPYRNTGGYRCDFDYERFYRWAKTQDNIYISEYNMPDDFRTVASIEKAVTMCSGGDKKAVEKLFTPKLSKSVIICEGFIYDTDLFSLYA